LYTFNPLYRLDERIEENPRIYLGRLSSFQILKLEPC
jgi:hypothetical protein